MTNKFYQSDVLIYNGTKMSIREFKALQKKQAKNKAKNSRRFKVLKTIPNDIKKMMRNIKVLKSLIAYNTHGYRQWGRIVNELMGMREIKVPFNQTVINAKQAIRLVTKIEKIANDNDSDVFQFIDKLRYKLEDTQSHLEMLVNGINSSGIMRQFGTHECINGQGKRLGLRILTTRSKKAISEISYICNKLNDIVENGIGIEEYDTKGRQIK